MVDSRVAHERLQALREIEALEFCARRAALAPHGKTLLAIVRNSDELPAIRLLTVQLLRALTEEDLLPGMVAAVVQRLEDKEWMMRAAALEFLGDLHPSMLSRASETCLLYTSPSPRDS